MEVGHENIHIISGELLGVEEAVLKASESWVWNKNKVKNPSIVEILRNG